MTDGSTGFSLWGSISELQAARASQDQLEPHRLKSVLQDAHFPVQRGARFSRKEARPSRKSCVVRIWALSAMASSSSRSISGAAKSQSNFLVTRRLTGLAEINVPARLFAVLIKSSGGEICETSPSR